MVVFRPRCFGFIVKGVCPLFLPLVSLASPLNPYLYNSFVVNTLNELPCFRLFFCTSSLLAYILFGGFFSELKYQINVIHLIFFIDCWIFLEFFENSDQKYSQRAGVRFENQERVKHTMRRNLLNQYWSGQKVRKKVFNWSEVHFYQSNFLQNPYLSKNLLNFV